MNNLDAARTDTLAWCGLSIIKPSGWEPAVLERAFLRMECRHAAIMDLRWAVIKGAFDPPGYLNRLRRKIKAQAELEPDLGPWAQAGAPALKTLTKRGMACAGFRWQDKKNPAGGPGAVIFSQHSKRAALFFFHGAAPDDSCAQWPGVLASYFDQAGLDWQQWSVFDLRAQVPGAYVLKRHSFRPGHYQLLFEKGKRWLVLEALGPASVILEGTELAKWARGFYRGGKDKPRLKGTPRQFEFQDGPACEWRHETWGLLGAGLPDWLPARKGCRLARIWWPHEGYKLLVVRAGGPSPLDLDLFENVCKNYEAL